MKERSILKNLKGIFLLVMVLVLSIGLSACADKGQEATSPENKVVEETNETTEEATSSEKPTEDPSGSPITIPESVDKIVVMAPSYLETIINLGQVDKVVGIDTQSQLLGYEEINADFPTFDMMAPDTEVLASLEPDLVFVSGVTDISGKDLYKDLKDLGITVINIPTANSLEELERHIMFLGNVLDKNEKATEIVETLKAEIEKVREISSTITDKKTVYFEIAAAPNSYSFGKNVYLNELIEIIGAENVLSDQEGWLSVEQEGLVAKNPDVILTNVTYVEDPVAEILSRDGWGEVEAVKNKEVYYIDNSSSSLPNENLVKALNEMAKVVYPDIYE